MLAGMDTDAIDAMFAAAGCTGQLCVRALDTGDELCRKADQQVVAASVFKVLVAVEAEASFADGRLDPRQQVTLQPDGRTPGPTGFSLFQDEVTATLRDLVVAMLTISDNVATDALLHEIGIEKVNATAGRLGLASTVIAGDVYRLVNSIAVDAGFDNWAAMQAWEATSNAKADDANRTRAVLAGVALDPSRTTRTSALDMARLLELIWADMAAPPAACDRVRQIMARQLTRHRLAAGFPPPAKVAAKSGSLIGMIRNEVGVVTVPDGRQFAAAVFTQADRPGRNDAAINAVIGQAAAAAVQMLSQSSRP
jgi:beta-lactamase class A